MEKSPRLPRSLVFLLLLLPLAFQAVAGVVFFLTALGADFLFVVALPLVAVITGFVCFWAGRAFVRRAYAPGKNTDASGMKPSHNFFVRYLGVVIACGYSVLVALIAVCLPAWGSGGVFQTAAIVLYFSHLPSSFATGFPEVATGAGVWMLLVPPFFIYLVYAFGMAWEFRRMGASRTQWRGRSVFAAAFVFCAVVLVWRVGVLGDSVLRYLDDVGRVDDSSRSYWEVNRGDYRPFGNRKDDKLVKIPAPTLAIESDHPRLSGESTWYPFYAAAAQAVYKNIAYAGSGEWVDFSTTQGACESLINGRADVIICAQPSPAQIAAAREKGVEFQLTPIGREAFVFFVNEDNPVDGLTSEQVRAIYTGRITNWREVGGRRGKILPFQRPVDSGSQTAMELQVMRGAAMVPPLKAERTVGGFGVALVLETAAYRNAPNALGYAFRFFVTTMAAEQKTKLLKIDGVAPTVETIRDGTYPYAGNFYAITTNRTANKPHVQELIAWFLSPQGQKLVEDSGYAPLGKTP